MEKPLLPGWDPCAGNLNLLDSARQHVAPADLRELMDSEGQPIIARLPEGWVWSDSAEGQYRMASVVMPETKPGRSGGVGLRRFIVYLRRLLPVLLLALSACYPGEAAMGAAYEILGPSPVCWGPLDEQLIRGWSAEARKRALVESNLQPAFRRWAAYGDDLAERCHRNMERAKEEAALRREWYLSHGE